MNAVTSRVDGSHLSATNHNIKAAAAITHNHPRFPSESLCPGSLALGAQRFGALYDFATRRS